MFDDFASLKSETVMKSFVFAGILSLTGCASWVAPQPPGVPTPSQISSYVTDVNNLSSIGAMATSPSSVTPTEVAADGYSLVDRNCNEYFSNVSQATNDTRFNRQEVTLAGALTAGTLAAVKASAASIAISALGIAFSGSSLDNYQNTALLTDYPNQVHQLVVNALAAYAKNAPPTDASLMTDVPTAEFYISGYAEICTYAGIEDLVGQAIQKAPLTDSNSGGVSAPHVVPAPTVVSPGIRPNIVVQ